MIIDLLKPGAAEIVVRSCALSDSASEEVMVGMCGTDGVVAAGAETPGADFGGVEFGL